MKYGICWYVGVGENDYKESSRGEFKSMRDLLEALCAGVTTFADEGQLFEALEEGPQNVIYWITDDFGFSFYRPELTC